MHAFHTSLALAALLCLSTPVHAGEGVVWTELGDELAGANGAPEMVMSGELSDEDPGIATISNLPANRRTFLFVGTVAANMPFKGGVLVPDTSLGPPAAFSSSDGEVVLSITVVGLPPGADLYFQTWVNDPTGPEGGTATNAWKATT